MGQVPSDREIELPLLKEILAAGGEIRPRELYPRMRRHFPNLTDADLAQQLRSGDNQWENRIRWARQHLVEKGELHRGPPGVWRITPKGRARVEGEPVVAEEPTAAPIRASEPRDEPPRLSVVSDPVDLLCDRLVETQKQSGTPRKYEVALADAFRFLGFAVTLQGKAGETDVLLETHIGTDSYRVVIDAKATHGDKVSDGQINWLAINQHQTQAAAQHAAVIGIGFRGGNLLRWATEYQVALIRTADLTEIIRMHDRAAFSLAELRPLFSTPGPTQQSLQTLTILYEASLRHWRLLVDVVALIDSYNAVNSGGLAATAESIRLMLFMKFAGQRTSDVDSAAVPSPDDVRDALSFLASRAVGILRESPPGSGIYRSVMHFDTAIKRVMALARVLETLEPREQSKASTDRSSQP